MNRFMAMAALLLFLMACKPSAQYVIEGSVTDPKCENEWVYLVPYENATSENVDSVKIVDGRFLFEGIAESPEMCIVRTKPILRFVVQELLVVREPGQINVVLSGSSSAQGTALNDSLQQWKDRKLMFDEIQGNIMRQFKNSSDSVKSLSLGQLDSLKNSYRNYNLAFIGNNKDNVVGQTIYMITKDLFSEDQRKSLGLEDLK